MTAEAESETKMAPAEGESNHAEGETAAARPKGRGARSDQTDSKGASGSAGEVGSASLDESGEVTAERAVEAILFSTDAPLTAGKLAQILGVGDASDVKKHVDSLNAKYDEGGFAFRIEGIARGYQMLTRREYGPWVAKLHKSRAESRLSAAALETLAIVAYRQPIMRADIEAIRGVAAGDMLVRLREANLVRIVGRAEEVGRPLLYGTTNRFLEVFGLRTLKDLPKLDPDKPGSVPALKAKAAEATDEGEPPS